MTIGIATPASAQSSGWYVEGGGGVNWLSDIQFDESGSEYEIDTDTGWAAGGRVGYGWDNGLRLEGEVTYRDNGDGVDLFVGPGGSPPGDSGDFDLFDDPIDVSSLALMGNVYYDIGEYHSITPYVGLGAGALLIEFEDASGNDGDETVFAAQARAGVNVAITDTLSASVDYTYLRGFDLSQQYCCGAVNDDYEAQTVIAGLRYTFMAPPAPPPAPATVVPVAETSFIIFFDWDSAALTAEANEVLDDVVVTVNQIGAASLLLDGYTDLSGSAEYNLGLSERRAQSAADGLIARGIAPDEIVIRAFGEENPLVPTPDGVREPQNRRVEIILG
ncbi:MAG: outer membrane beta-barrel protein [Pseudomonadota bacterium]